MMKPVKFLAIYFVIFLLSCGDESVAYKTQPYIRLYGKRIDTVGLNSIYKDEMAEADGCNDVVSSGSVNTSVPGTYYIDYNYTDPKGNQAATITRTVHVIVRNSDSVQIQKALNLFANISISKHWRSSKNSNNEIEIVLKTQPVVYVDFKTGPTISSYEVKEVKNTGNDLTLITKKLLSDSTYIWSFEVTGKDRGVWSVQKPQLNYKMHLGSFTADYSNRLEL